VETHTEAQIERAAALLQMQEEYRFTLSSLYDERAEIIEDSRLRETALRAQAEERVGELSAQVEQGQAELSAAIEELSRLTTEQERAARLESQMNAYYSTANSHINERRLDEASNTLSTMREFLAAPSFQGIRAVEARRQTHLAAIAALEGAVAETRRLTEAAVPGAQDEVLVALQTRNATLEQQLDAQRQLATASGSDQTRLISELQTANANMDTQITSLLSETATYRVQVQQTEAELEDNRRRFNDLNQRNTDLQARYDDLQDRLDTALRLFQPN
jgi:chromosome segregation ATPase